MILELIKLQIHIRNCIELHTFSPISTMRKKQNSRLLDPKEEAQGLLRLIHHYHLTAGRYPNVTQFRYYGYTEYEAIVCIRWLKMKGLIVLDKDSHIISHTSPYPPKP